jgi:hypothetical protein
VNSDLLQRFCQHILERGGTLYPPSISENLERFERAHDLRLPTALRDLYLISNGSDYDNNIDRVLPVEELQLSESSLFGKVIWFYEHSIFVQVWGVVVSSGQVIDWNDRLVAASTSDFLEKYIDPGIQCA